MDGPDSPSDWLTEHFCHYIHLFSSPELCGYHYENHDISCEDDHPFVGVIEATTYIDKNVGEITEQN